MRDSPTSASSTIRFGGRPAHPPVGGEVEPVHAAVAAAGYTERRGMIMHLFVDAALAAGTLTLGAAPPFIAALLAEVDPL